jgi:autotransporter-associated beta strand protein
VRQNLFTRRRAVIQAAGAALVSLYGFEGNAFAVDDVGFSASSVGTTKSINQWGIEVVDGNPLNLAQSIATMGSNLTIAATYFDLNDPLNSDGSLSGAQQQAINNQINDILEGDTTGQKLSISMGPSVSGNNSEYTTNNSANVAEWAQAMVASKQYWVSHGYNVSWAGPYTEPDYWGDEGSAQQGAEIMQALQANPAWGTGTQLLGASTLDADNAESFYQPLEGIANAGSTHMLGGSLSSYISFIQDVQASGGQFAAPEMHSLGEAIVSANYGAIQGVWWGPALMARGTFVQASNGKQIGYAQDLNDQTAAAVYRAPSGQTYAFAGGLERFGSPTSYEFTSDRNAYFNGIGPLKTYTLQANYDNNPDNTPNGSNDFSNFGAYFDQGADANVDYGSGSVPALDGYRWTIQNVQTGQVLTVAGNSTSDGASIDSSVNSGSLSQLWNITRTQDGYMELFNANSNLTVGVNGASTSSGASVVQYGTAGTQDEQWYLNPAANGTFYIQDGNSNLYLTSNSTNCTQQKLSTVIPGLQEWRFVQANPTTPAIANYKFAGNANDSTGNFNATVSGTATYGAGPTAGSQALNFDGSSTYLTLPSSLTPTTSGGTSGLTSAVTVDTWVKWNGGNPWQRIFDFGTGTNAYMFLTPDSSAGTMRFAITTGGGSQEEDFDTTELTTGTWVNLAVTLGGHSVILYVNGRPVTAGQILFNPSSVFTGATTIDDFIGKSQYSADPLFSGSMSGFQIWNYALTQSQVDDLINNNLTWVGGQNGNAWDGSTTANFKLPAGTSSVFNQGDRVTFDGTGTSPVVVTGTVSPFSVTVTGSSNITFSGSGSISGSQTPLTMSGSGTLTIANTGGNSYTGDTTINSGTISISADNDLGSDAANLTLNGGALQTTSSNAMVLGHSTLVATGGGTLSIMGNGVANTTQSDRITLNSQNALIGSGPLTISGDGTLAGASPNTTASGAGALVLTASNTFNGNVTLQNGGLLEFAAADAIDPSATVTLGNEGEFTIANGLTSANNIVVNGGTNSVISFTNAGASTVNGAITLNANATIGLRDWYDYADVRSGTISGNISGAGGLNINSGSGAGGTLTLTGDNTYNGGTAVSGATLLLAAASAFPNNTSLKLTSGNADLAKNIGPVTLSSLTIIGNSTFDISNNHIFINYDSGSDPIATIAGYLNSGFNGGSWNGPGIISTAAQTPTNGFRYGIGWADGADGVVSGLSSGQIELKYTLLGDANLDGVVNGSDFSILAANFGLGETNWDQGNFLFTPTIDGSDFSALAANFGQGDSGADASVSSADIAALDAFAAANGLLADVPEPQPMLLAIAAGAGVLSSRRRLLFFNSDRPNK